MDYPQFTKEMRKDYTILFPNMVPDHFKLLNRVFQFYGYHTAVPTIEGRPTIDEGLKYVHNDTCYPALICIGQMIYTIKNGPYDPHKVALMMPQTGGGCRASNYIFLLRKALEKADLGFVPVISLNFNGLESCPGFRPTLPMVRRAMASLAYGDLLMLLRNQTLPYEIHKGDSEALLDSWVDRLCELFSHGKGLSTAAMTKWFGKIAQEFAQIPCDRSQKKVKVGVVGEIYVKFAPFANNHLVDFLWSQDCEVMVPGLLEFILYCVQDNLEDYRLYGDGRVIQKVSIIARNYLMKIKDALGKAAKDNGFTPASSFLHLASLADGVIDRGCKMGEGWLLTAEMIELIELGYENIVAVQPFGCLPNHIVAKGMVRTVKERHPNANIVPIDYDPGATVVNQQNRIKLMLSIAKERLEGNFSDFARAAAQPAEAVCTASAK